MMLAWVSLSVLAVCLLSWPGGVQSARCPWNEEGLSRWSNRRTWSSGRVPGDNDKVTIPSGKRVLLDVQPASLATLTIEADGALIWGDVDGLVLNAHYILVRGEFHIGSKSCRFLKKAHIRLHGQTDSKHYVEEESFGRKFIGVAPGGTLELHGKKKTAWTKLAQTVKPVKDTECALVYDHADTTTNVFAGARPNGLHVIVWNKDGSVLDFKVFKEIRETQDFFTTIPDGKVVGMFAFGKDGIGSNAKQLIPTIEAFGGSLIAHVKTGDSYSFLAQKGDPDSVQEFTKPLGQSKSPADPGFLSLHDPSQGLVFQVSKSTTEMFQFFRVVKEEAAYPVLTLAEEVVGWAEGDEVLVTSTDYDWTQAETRRIRRCGRSCPLGKRQIKVDDSFNYLHYGNFTYNVDERAEVAILTRNIFIEGVMEDECYFNNKEEKKLCDKFEMDIFGGHIKVTRGHRSVHVRGVELYHMGQQNGLGRYPLHCHLCDDVPGMYLSENSIHHTFSRCITVHGTNRLLVSHNVCYKHFGHGIFLEDGVEQFNTFLGNLVAGSQFGTLLLSDTSKDWCKMDHKDWVENCGDLASYWITHPNNNFTGNVAAGGQGKGYMFVFADRPLGPSLKRQQELGIPHHPKDMPILDFTGNVAHSCGQDGLFLDSKISTGTGMENKGMVPENGIIQSQNEYDPRIDGIPVWTDIAYGTFYKNHKHNLWIKGGNVRVAYTTVADAAEGLAGGTTLVNTGTQAYKTLFVGETENKGLGKKTIIATDAAGGEKKTFYFDRSFPGIPTNSLTAVSIYQGPIILKSCFFDKYVTKTWCPGTDPASTECADRDKVTRHAGAISFKRSNTYPSMTSSYVQNNTFGFCDNEDGTKHWVFHGNPSIPDWQWKDGNKAVYFMDKDGMLTGTVNASVVSDFPIYKGPECLSRPDWGDLLICPYRYVKLEILGTTGNLEKVKQRDYPMIIQRNDAPYDVPFSIKGEIRNEYLLRTHRSYIIDFNDTKSDAAFPADFKLYGYGVERGDVVRVGLCQPLNVKGYDIVLEYPVYRNKNVTWVDNLDDLDKDTTGDAFFHDKVNGILFFKMLSFDTDVTDTEQCPQGKCWKAKINAIGGSFKKMRSCAKIPIPPFNGRTRTPRKVRSHKCPGISRAQGVGSVNWDNVDFVVKDEFSIPCSTLPEPVGRGTVQHLGCFKDKISKYEFQTDLAGGEMLELFNTMTTDFCVNRCYYRGYKYVALSQGSRCTCGNVAMTTGGFVADPSQDCNEQCAGNTNQTCGGKKAFDIWKTGN